MINAFLPEDHQKVKVMRVALADADTAGGVAAVANPFGAKAIIVGVWLDLTTAATAACTVDAGVAANGTTSSDTLLDGIDVNTAIGIFNNTDDQGTNGKVVATWSSTQYVTASKATGAAAGLEGYLYIACVHAV